MLAQGWQPYSINVGGKWYSYRRLDPFASLLGPVADFVELSKQIPSTDRDKLCAAVVTALASNLIYKTYLSGLSDLAVALHDPQQDGQRLIDSLSGGVIPAGVAQYTRTEDPILRDAKSTLDSIRARIPGQSEMLPPRLTLFPPVSTSAAMICSNCACEQPNSWRARYSELAGRGIAQGFRRISSNVRPCRRCFFFGGGVFACSFRGGTSRL
jgi:hypothetical protein